MTHTHELSKETLRAIIFGQIQYKKCPNCDNNGMIHYNGETGDGALPYSLPEWGEWAETEECEQCSGLGFVSYRANNSWRGAIFNPYFGHESLCLVGILDYEGSDVFGVFSSWEKAQNVFDEYQAKVKTKIANGCWDDTDYDRCLIQEVEIDRYVF